MDRLKKRATVFAFAALAFSALASATTIEGQAWRLTNELTHDLTIEFCFGGCLDLREERCLGKPVDPNTRPSSLMASRFDCDKRPWL